MVYDSLVLLLRGGIMIISTCIHDLTLAYENSNIKQTVTKKRGGMALFTIYNQRNQWGFAMINCFKLLIKMDINRGSLTSHDNKRKIDWMWFRRIPPLIWKMNTSMDVMVNSIMSTLQQETPNFLTCQLRVKTVMTSYNNLTIFWSSHDI